VGSNHGVALRGAPRQLKVSKLSEDSRKGQ
jgi:hypothetical protein